MDDTQRALLAPWPCEADPVWRRMAAQALQQSRDQLDRIPPRLRDIGDPNHPAYDGIFGEDRATFLARQYR